MWSLPVEFRQLQKLHNVDSTFPCFALREEGMRKAQAQGDFSLIEASLFTRGDQFSKNRIVLSLERSRPSFP